MLGWEPLENVEEHNQEIVDVPDAFFESNSEQLIDISDNIANYMTDIANILTKNEFITVHNGLELNHHMQDYLKQIRRKVVVWIEKCRELYKCNSELLTDICNKPYSYKSRANYCAAPFFKGASFLPCRNHFSYFNRRQLDEFFPMDMQNQLGRSWTPGDKIHLVNNLTVQMLKHKGRSITISFDSLDGADLQVIFVVMFDFFNQNLIQTNKI